MLKSSFWVHLYPDPSVRIGTGYGLRKKSDPETIFLKDPNKITELRVAPQAKAKF